MWHEVWLCSKHYPITTSCVHWNMKQHGKHYSNTWHEVWLCSKHHPITTPCVHRNIKQHIKDFNVCCDHRAPRRNSKCCATLNGGLAVRCFEKCTLHNVHFLVLGMYAQSGVHFCLLFEKWDVSEATLKRNLNAAQVLGKDLLAQCGWKWHWIYGVGMGSIAVVISSKRKKMATQQIVLDITIIRGRFLPPVLHYITLTSQITFHLGWLNL